MQLNEWSKDDQQQKKANDKKEKYIEITNLTNNYSCKRELLLCWHCLCEWARERLVNVFEWAECGILLIILWLWWLIITSRRSKNQQQHSTRDFFLVFSSLFRYVWKKARDRKLNELMIIGRNSDTNAGGFSNCVYMYVVCFFVLFWSSFRNLIFPLLHNFNSVSHIDSSLTFWYVNYWIFRLLDFININSREELVASSQAVWAV